MGLALTTGLMGIMTPYATGAALPFYNSGYLTPAEFWRLGTIFARFPGRAVVVGCRCCRATQRFRRPPASRAGALHPLLLGQHPGQ